MIALPQYHLPGAGTLDALGFESHDHLDIDSRGLIKLWEPPRPNARYVMGVDPTAGLTNWHRSLRNDDDAKTDNGVIEIIRVGNGINIPDVQVGEYAAPIDAEDLADVCAMLGRMYCGNSEMGEALCILEVWPGPGALTVRRLINHYGYSNLWRWEFLASLVPSITNEFGWRSDVKTLQLLWSRYARHLAKSLAVIKSPWLMEELSDLQNIAGKTFPQPSGERKHDDRVRAHAMAVWAAHDWGLAEMPEPQKVDKGERDVPWQASDCSLDRMMDLWEEQYQRIVEG